MYLYKYNARIYRCCKEIMNPHIRYLNKTEIFVYFKLYIYMFACVLAGTVIKVRNIQLINLSINVGIIYSHYRWINTGPDEGTLKVILRNFDIIEILRRNNCKSLKILFSSFLKYSVWLWFYTNEYIIIKCYMHDYD